VSQSRGRQAKAVDHAGSVANLFHNLLERIVGSDLLPVNVRKAVVGQGLVDGLLDKVGYLGHLACPQVTNDHPALVVGGLTALRKHPVNNAAREALGGMVGPRLMTKAGLL
jgi:hypothetical protein